MTKYSTEDLILFIYGETSQDQYAEIAMAIKNDYKTREKYVALRESIKGLNNIVSSPRQQTIDSIMAYAKSTSEVTS